MKHKILLAVSMALLISLLVVTIASARGPVIHRVNVGGPDICSGYGLAPGCDRNFSLTVVEFADGKVTGEWTDQWGESTPYTGGFHAQIDCLVVDGNDAWVSGVVVSGTFNGIDIAGFSVGARVRDNGVSANDPADQISLSIPGISPAFKVCTEKPNYPLFDAIQGQVTVD